MLLDFFGTLVELDSDVPRSWELLTQLGFESSPELEAIWSTDAFDGSSTPAGSLYGGWQRGLFAAHAQAAGVPCEQLARVVDELAANDRRWTVRARPGALGLLRALRDEGIAAVVCSNWDYKITSYLCQAGLPTDLCTLCSWEVGMRKPAPLIFERSLRLINADRNAAVVLGDSFACDIVGAIRAEIDAIWVGGDETHPVVRAGLARVVADLDEAGRILCG
ncbi:MAG TPA: HAD family hydrolase [Solirubrobacterales bacterium]|nr:HAD family hydrolase [Solirubrobacterales bacterium]